ncbi:MAG: PIN domain nuclease [Rhodospirillales bacterium]
MILVDTSVWIDHFNNVENSEVQTLRRLLSEGQVAIGDLILLEILQGAGSDALARLYERQLGRLPALALMSPALAVRAAAHYRTLRGLGISVRKLADLVIGSFCIEGGFTLLHRDRDFTHMERHLGLRTLSPSMH